MPPPPPPGRLIRRGLRVLRSEVALHPRPFFAGVAGAAVYAAATVASSWVLARVVDHVIAPRFRDGRVGTGALVAGAAAVIAVGLVKAGGIICRRVGATRAKFRVEATLRTQVIERYQQLPMSWHQAHPTGELLAHANADVEAATEILAPLPFATGVITLLALTAAWMLATDPFLAVIGMLLLPSLLGLNLLYQRRLEGPAHTEQRLIGTVSAVALESFDGALVVKTLGAEDAEAARFDEAAVALRDAKVRVATIRARFDALLDSVPAVGTIVVLLVGAWRVRSGDLTTGVVVGFVNLLSLLVWPLRLIGYVLGDLPRTVAGWDRVQGVLLEEVPAPPAQPRPVPRGPVALEVRDLAFAYEPGTPTLAEVGFDIPAGATMALVGPTGSGKSTLLLLLAGLLDAGEGTISLSGVDLAATTVEERALAVSLVFQEPFLFGASVRENILLGLERPAAPVEEALRLAQADAFVAALPAGADTVVGERGATLSGGQRQRIALARALVRAPRLLLLDDATSSVDPTTEAHILQGLAGLAGTTTLMVATRPSTIAIADGVLFLDEGRVTGRGSHAALLASHPAYAALVRAYEQSAVSP